MNKNRSRPVFAFLLVMVIIYFGYFLLSNNGVKELGDVLKIKIWELFLFAALFACALMFGLFTESDNSKGQPLIVAILKEGARFRVLACRYIDVSDNPAANKEHEYIFLLLVENLGDLDTASKVDANRGHYVRLTSLEVEDSSIFSDTNDNVTFTYSAGKVRRIGSSKAKAA